MNGLNCFYDDTLVIPNFSFQVDENETVIFYGPNGHGKSSLLRGVAGLVPPKTKGSIKFKGEEITETSVVTRAKNGIRYVPERPTLFSGMTVEENLLLARRFGKEQILTMESLFKLFPVLKDRKKQTSSSLSGGERKMLSIGSSLISSAELLLLDEPFLGLAPILREKLTKRLMEAKKNNITLIITEQFIIPLLEMADKIIFLKKGEIVTTEKTNLEENHINKIIKKNYVSKSEIIS